MPAKEGEVVCVIGGSGFIGSWIVKLFLERGYTVHATVKDIKDENETKHLEALEGASERLRLFQVDVLDYDSIVAAVKGASGVIHLGFPGIVEGEDDPMKIPAVKGTINALKAAKQEGVKRVVVTSSSSAIIPSPNWPADRVKNEECWTDIEYCKKKGGMWCWYAISKALSEKAASEFAKENGLDVVFVNPGVVLGPILPPNVAASSSILLGLLKGSTEAYEDCHIGIVHVKDVALAHILLYENKSATGRHLCVEAITHYSDFAAKVAELYPEYNIPSFPKDTQPGLLRAKDASKKLMDLGLQFTPEEQIIRDAVESLKAKGVIS